MLKLWKTISAPESREDLFVARYERLLGWALHLTGQDRQRAEDLLHTAFIEFTLGGTDLAGIENLDGYLRTVLRNLHLSEVRKATRLAVQSLSLAEYDSAAMGLRTLDPQFRLRAQDELRAVCQYACRRKETSKAGGVFILRFFHGYYPSEIVRVLRGSSRAVSEWLRIARGEAKIFLEDPRRLSFMRERAASPPPRVDFGRAAGDVERALRHAIFAAPRDGVCRSPRQWAAAYHEREEATIDCRTLAHLVACAPCLDSVNALLGLPLLAERHPQDGFSGDSRPKAVPLGKNPDNNDDDNDEDDPGQPGGGAGAGDAPLSSFRRRARESFEHRPEQLCIAANGLFVAAQTISADHSEQTLSLNLPEQIGFIEVLSEQDLRLLLLGVEPPPEGPAEQSKRVQLSDGRSLRAIIRFSSAQPALHVVYHDPALAAHSAGAEEWVSGETRAEDEESPRFPFPFSEVPSLWRRLFDPGLWLRPGVITTLVMALLTAAFLLLRPAAPVSAAKLLSQARASEAASAERTDSALHRTINLEERRSPGGELLARRRIEVWQSAAATIKAQRLYDEKGYLIAGEWTRAGGARAVYQRGAGPRLHPAPEPRPALSFESTWQRGPSAKEFTALVGRPEQARVEERPAVYVISYRVDQQADHEAQGLRGLLQVTLVLSRADLRAVEQTLLVEQAGETREFRFVETSFERRPMKAVAPAVFEPEPELLGSDGATGRRGDGAIVLTASPPPPGSPSPAVATAELEVEALSLLNQAGADLDEQASVARTADGRLRVSGLVEDQRRKDELLRALGPISHHQAILIEIETIAEALSRRARQQSTPEATTKSAPDRVSVQRVAIAQDAIAAEADLRRYFAGREPVPQIDAEINRLASRVVNRSSQAMSHRGALRRLMRQFSPEDLRALSPEARAQWLAIIRTHAAAFARETGKLRRELQPIFFPALPADPALEAIEIGSDDDLARAVERLAELGAANDRVIRAAFTTSTDDSAGLAIKSPQFWRSLRNAEQLAEKIARRQ
ncbi:MAG: hypothetical protein ACREVR_03015 [Burkholderiales bacterium]